MVKSKCLFVIPKFSSKNFPGRTMGPDYIGSHLRETNQIENHNVSDWDILDLDILDFKDINNILIGKLKNSNYAFIGISYLSIQAEEAIKIAKLCANELKKIGQREEKGSNSINYTNIILGGKGTIDAEEIAHYYPYIDFFVIGKYFHEPFDSVTNIAKLIQKYGFIDYKKRKEISGIVYYNKFINKSYRTKTRKKKYSIDFYFKNLERKNHNDKYNFEIWQGEKKTAQIYSGIGCNGFCNYCFESMRSNSFENRSIENIYSEVLQLIRLGYRGLFFQESTFTENKEKAIKLIRFMGKLNKRLNIDWACNTRIDCLDEEIINEFIQNGMYYIRCGVETLVPEVVEGIGKITPKRNPFYSRVGSGKKYIEKAKSIYRYMSKKGIYTDLLLILGCPKNKNGEIVLSTLDDEKRSIYTGIWKLNPNIINLNLLKFLPDAAMSRIPIYKNFRGGNDYKGSFFYKEWRIDNKVNSAIIKNKVYLAFSTTYEDYPISKSLTPMFCYKLLCYTINEANRYYKKTGKYIYININKVFFGKNMKFINGIYYIKEFNQLT